MVIAESLQRKQIVIVPRSGIFYMSAVPAVALIVASYVKCRIYEKPFVSKTNRRPRMIRRLVGLNRLVCNLIIVNHTDSELHGCRAQGIPATVEFGIGMVDY